MDQESFDRLARFISAASSRRAALSALVGTVLAGTSLRGASAKRQQKGHDRKKAKTKAKAKNQARAEAARCCSRGSCVPGKGKNLSKCCYQTQDLAGKNFSGANLGQANFAGATLTKANLQGANAGKACFVDAILSNAKINGSTNLGGAIFCRTTMPDGSVNDSGCNRSTRCCQTCIAVGEACGADIGGECCGDATCVDGVCACRDDNAFACGTSGNGCGPACADDEACVDGACVSCADACPDSCSTCVRLVDGSTRCADLVGSVCPAVCTPSDPCDSGDCAFSIIDRSDDSVDVLADTCGNAPGTGVCSSINACP